MCRHPPLTHTRSISAPSSSRSRSVSTHNTTNSPPHHHHSFLQHTTSLLMWCPFHCWMPRCLPQRRIHPAMMNVLGSHSNSQLEHSFKAPALSLVSLSWRHHYAFGWIMQFKLKRAREMLSSEQLEEVRGRRLLTVGGTVVGKLKVKWCVWKMNEAWRLLTASSAI